MPFSIINVCATFCEVTKQSSQPEQNLGETVCIANLGLYKGCWGGEMVALTQARFQTGLPPTSLQA